jgi:hypothetical protein
MTQQAIGVSANWHRAKHDTGITVYQIPADSWVAYQFEQAATSARKKKGQSFCRQFILSTDLF